MSQRENLWGRYRPVEGVFIDITEQLPGSNGPLAITYTLKHRNPEPNVVVSGVVDEWGREGLPATIAGVLRAYMVHSPTQSLLALQRGLLRIEQEYCP